MAKAELVEEAAAAATGPVDVLIGLSGAVDPSALRVAIEHAARAFNGTGTRVAIAHMDAGDGSVGPDVSGDASGDGAANQIRLLAYKPANSPAGGAAWLTSGATYASLFSLARTTGARASVIINADLAALEHDSVARLAAPILSGDCELAMPIYSQSRFAGLLNASVLAPLTRALYGKRVRYPLAQDFAVAPALLTLLEHPSKRVQPGGENLFWPATEASIRERKICQVYLDLQHETIAEGIDLTTVLSQVVGPLFADMETNAQVWQRVRGSHAVPANGAPFAPVAEVGKIDTRPMVDSFNLATRNLQDVWSLVLPPVTQLELKKLARVQPEQFHLPDALWVRILYDFALAHRLRTLSRSHLMGAFTPLYLAWVASYAGEVSAMSDGQVDARLEQLAVAYETGKPYLLSRWRWPDRFNP